MKQYNNEKPRQIENTSLKVTLNYNIHESTQEEIQQAWDELRMEDMPATPDEWFVSGHKYAYYQTQVPMGLWTRDAIINAIIRDKYRQDEMEAITNNMAAINAVFMQTLVSDGILAATKYLKDSINDENSQKFKEMQEWRAMAKEVAKSIIKE